jgi:hypothetical protein
VVGSYEHDDRAKGLEVQRLNFPHLSYANSLRLWQTTISRAQSSLRTRRVPHSASRTAASTEAQMPRRSPRRSTSSNTR